MNSRRFTFAVGAISRLPRTTRNLACQYRIRSSPAAGWSSSATSSIAARTAAASWSGSWPAAQPGWEWITLKGNHRPCCWRHARARARDVPMG